MGNRRRQGLEVEMIAMVFLAEQYYSYEHSSASFTVMTRLRALVLAS